MKRNALRNGPWRAALLAGLAGVMLASGCSGTPPTRYHSLMLPPGATAPPARAAAGTIAWEVQPVSVPAQVDQAPWVVRSVDGGLLVLEQERWIGPLGDELRLAVTQRVTQIIGPAATGPGRDRWDVRIEVQRFESAPGREARLEAVWTVSSLDKPTVALRCRGAFVQVVERSGGYVALASGHQQAAAQLGDAIGTALKAMAASRQGSCEG